MYEHNFIRFVKMIDLIFDQLKFVNVNRHKIKIEKFTAVFTWDQDNKEGPC